MGEAHSVRQGFRGDSLRCGPGIQVLRFRGTDPGTGVGGGGKMSSTFVVWEKHRGEAAGVRRRDGPCFGHSCGWGVEA